VTRHFEFRYLIYYQFKKLNWYYIRYLTSKYHVTTRKWYVCGEERLCQKVAIWGVVLDVCVVRDSPHRQTEGHGKMSFPSSSIHRRSQVDPEGRVPAPSALAAAHDMPYAPYTRTGTVATRRWRRRVSMI
jgi:hypothetical protein